MSKTNVDSRRLVEKGPGIINGLKDLKNHLNANTISAGVLAAIFGCTGPVLLIVNAAMNAGYTNEQTISWLFSVYFFGGLLGLILALKYKQPISGAWSIPAAVLLGSTLTNFSINEAVGAYLLAGLFVLILGFSGLIGKVMRWIPLPIVMGMIAGAMIRFGTGLVSSIESLPVVGFITLAVFLLSTKFLKKVPPILTALVAGIITAVITGDLNFSQMDIAFTGPTFYAPSFSLDAIISISIPVAILVVGAENAQATGVLFAEGYKPPINAMTVFSGFGGIITSFFGGPNANIAGPMTAICSSDAAGPKKESRYAASVVDGVLFGGFGLVASIAVGFIKGIPWSLITIVAGLAMIGVLTQAYKEAFSSGKYRYGSFFALIIAMSGISLFKISAPFWALVGGAIISLIVETDDFKKEKTQ